MTTAVERTLLGGYQILSELGSGGMGKVYRAEVVGKAAGLEPGTLVAMKVIHPHLLETPGFFKRFLREAQLGQEVEHDNVVRTHDCDATLLDGQQQNFIVMEYVEGQTLRELLRDLERVPEELCRHVGREVAKGLGAIHAVGAVHRDIKPENVLITEAHVVKVMDLGVARLQEEAIRLSQTGTFVGSVEYAAPEQFKFEEPADHRADLHALGVMLYELSTGQHPYRDTDFHRMLGNIINETPRKPGEVNPQLSPFFEEVINTLIAKDRGDRFADAALLAQVLEEGEQGAWWEEKAKALRVETRRPLRRIRVPRETALYGRDDDIEKLHAVFDKARAGDGQVLLLEGEAGIGKTRLVDEFVGRLRQAGEDINFLFGSYPPGGAATSTGAFSEAYREQFGEALLEDTLAECLSATPVLVPAFAALLRGESTPPGEEPLTKESLQTVFVHATRSLAAERPTIVLIDDLHFAPEDGRALFASLTLAVPGHRVLLVGTSRPGLAEDWVANLERTGHFLRMALSRLGPKDLVRLLKDSLRSDRLANELGAQIAVKSDGNPFFAFEIIRGLREGQFITQQADGTWVSTQVIRDIQIPSSVMDLIQARIADLNDDERNLLDVASCCGFQFDAALAGQVLGLALIPTLQSFGKVEKRHRLVRSTGRNHAFDHHQVQEALYGGLSEQLREAYHAAIADVLETREMAADKDPKDVDGALCLDLCEHALKGAQGARALRYLDAALDHLERGYLNDGLLDLARRALEVKGLLNAKQRVRVLLRQADRLDLLGRREAQGAALEEAGVIADQTDDVGLRAKVRQALGGLLHALSDNEAAQVAFEEARELARAAGDRELQAGTIGNIGNVLRALGNHTQAQVHHERACALSREIGYRWGEALATGNLGGVFSDLGRYTEAREHFERARTLNHEIGNRQGEALATGNLGTVLQGLGRSAEAQEHYERLRALSGEIGFRQGEAIATANLGNLFMSLGRYAEAQEHNELARALFRETGYRVGEAIATGNLGTVLHGLGRSAEAREHYERVGALSREIGYRPGEGDALAGLARLAEAKQASRLQEEALVLRRELGESDVAETLIDLGRLEGALGNTASAAAYLDEALALARETTNPKATLCAMVERARLPGGVVESALAALAEHEEHAGHSTRMEARFRLWELTGDLTHLAEAHRLLAHLRDHAPADCRDSMIENVPLHCDIMTAWNEQP